MDRPKYRWEWPEPDAGAEAALAAGLGVPRLVARLLAARGWTDPDEARRFLEAGEASFHDPWTMKGMGEAVERIRRALRNGERILVYGDYDADGVCSTALMVRLFSRLGADFETYIPNRAREGYGLNKAAVDRAAEDGIRLIVTVDNGISAVEEIAYARERGIDVVVTDHHEPPDVLPEAVALVNPKQADCPYPFKGLCGAGVAFKLAHALLGRPETAYADLAAIGTVADLMPLVDENRAIVRIGLDRMRRAASPGVRALAEIGGFSPAELSSGRIAFGLAPRLNAGGRLETADDALRLLVTERDEEAAALARELDRLNRERQQLVDRTTAEAEDRLLAEASARGGQLPEVLVAADAAWNTGVVGLVAARLAERYVRPAVVLAEEEATGLCRGSARSVEGFDLHAALTACRDLLEHFGGHRAAAGLIVRREHLAELARRLEALAAAWLRPEDRVPRKRADAVCTADELTLEAVERLALLEPFGQANPAPLVVLRRAVIKEVRAIGSDGRHLRLTVEQDGHRLEAVGFGMGDLFPWLVPGLVTDLLGAPSVNEWQGIKRVQLQLQDLRYAGVQVLDRRGENADWLNVLFQAAPDACAVLCSTDREAAAWRDRLSGRVPVVCFADLTSLADRDGADQKEALMADASLRSSEVSAAAAADLETFGQETAATAEVVETASTPGLSANPGGTSHEAHRAADWTKLRHLVLAGFPDGAAEAEAFAGLLRRMDSLMTIQVYGGAHPRRMPAGAIPDRNHFRQVYALFRAKGSWPDVPDGFLREVSERTGWPLAVVRIMQDVFAELGFLRIEGGKVIMEPSPSKRDLWQSVRYRRARIRWAGERLAVLSAEALAEWVREARLGLPEPPDVIQPEP